MSLEARLDHKLKTKVYMPSIHWISEKEAADMLGYQPETLRRYVKSGKLDISYSPVTDRKYFYDQKGIEKLINKKAIIVP
jgi:predicted site-specific integrase-resolvase